jgi:hypothetical protein
MVQVSVQQTHASLSCIKLHMGDYVCVCCIKFLILKKIKLLFMTAWCRYWYSRRIRNTVLCKYHRVMVRVRPTGIEVANQWCTRISLTVDTVIDVCLLPTSTELTSLYSSMEYLFFPLFFFHFPSLWHLCMGMAAWKLVCLWPGSQGQLTTTSDQSSWSRNPFAARCG